MFYAAYKYFLKEWKEKNYYKPVENAIAIAKLFSLD